ncbi:DUF1674 domain-containing protein [Candidatus Megaera polyxenophila]|jgi:hypothetical protein|nr:DUF1674 domain-containing protein [Candidatus Megaera polyxenophila]
MLKEQSYKQLSDSTLTDKNKASKKDSKPFSVLSKDEEFGGPKGPEPTRYGDWEVNGRVSDF